MTYFVMLNLPYEGITPIVNDDEEVALFETEKEAIDIADKNIMGAAYGYEIYENTND